MGEEEARWAKGTPKEATTWFSEDGAPKSHLPLLTGFVLETKDSALVNHFGQKIALPRDYMALKVGFVQNPSIP